MGNHDKHGLSNARIYRIWSGMKRRCLIEKHISYSNYGGRGITVSESWMNFFNYYNDMKDEYEKHCIEHGIKNTSLDRIDNEKGYSKENCRWATTKVQTNNTRERSKSIKPKKINRSYKKAPADMVRQKTYVERKIINGTMRNLIISCATNEILNVI